MSKSTCPNGPTNLYTISSPLGDLEVTSCSKGIHSLSLTKVSTGPEFKPNLRVKPSIVNELRIDTYKPVLKCVDWLDTFFNRPHNMKCISAPPICHLMNNLHKEKFTPTVWKTLLEKVPFGETVSYGELAVKSGFTVAASRAVGTAMQTNRVSLIIPCHRVIPSTGGVGNYSSGTRNSVKAWLLQHEAVIQK